jgi:hypothetical protein
MPSEDELGRVSSMSSIVQNPSTTTGLIQAPNSSRQSVPSKDDASIASGSSGNGSLTKKKSATVNEHLFVDVDPQSIISSTITDSGISETSETAFDRTSASTVVSSSQNLNAQQNNGEMGHSRNSSNTSQVCCCCLIFNFISVAIKPHISCLINQT